MDMAGTPILHVESEVPDMTQHNTLPILKYPYIIARNSCKDWIDGEMVIVRDYIFY